MEYQLLYSQQLHALTQSEHSAYRYITLINGVLTFLVVKRKYIIGIAKPEGLSIVSHL